MDNCLSLNKMAGFRLYKGPGLLAHAYSVKHRVFTDISTSTTTKPFVVRVVRVRCSVCAFVVGVLTSETLAKSLNRYFLLPPEKGDKKSDKISALGTLVSGLIRPVPCINMVGIGRPQVLRHSVCFLQHAFLSPGHGTLFLGCLLSNSTS